MKLGIFGRQFEKKCFEGIKEFFSTLDSKKIEITIHEKFHAFLFDHQLINKQHLQFHDTEGIKDCNYIITIGGDGTLLEAITLIRDLEIPILGINAGRLGFMATTPVSDSIPALEDLLSNNVTIETRSLVSCETDQEIFKELNFGLNELAIQKKDTSSMIVIHTYLNVEFLNSYWADGLIIATATGSTGYSLSCGGPLLMPGNNNFIIAPVNPHNLNVRPMVVPDSSVLTFELEGRAKRVLLSLDARSISTPTNIKLMVKKADFNAKLVQPRHYSYFNTLRNKLNWGIDARN